MQTGLDTESVICPSGKIDWLYRSKFSSADNQQEGLGGLRLIAVEFLGNKL